MEKPTIYKRLQSAIEVTEGVGGQILMWSEDIVLDKYEGDETPWQSAADDLAIALGLEAIHTHVQDKGDQTEVRIEVID